ncbi:hypothetical protein ACFWAZ_29035 [Streptomyces collinus]|uniref:hypothetical protein n=1 Tax=Streptomyces collinus TaxID=42684 RepID=UPI003663E7EF
MSGGASQLAGVDADRAVEGFAAREDGGVPGAAPAYDRFEERNARPGSVGGSCR